MSLRNVLFAVVALSLGFVANGATIEKICLESNFLAVPDSVVVITPDVAADSRCPTVYLLNGFSDNHLSWSTRTRPDLPELADKYGVILVMPNGQDSWYWDSPIDPGMQMESFFISDLVPYIDSNYNTLAEPSKRAITGLSMGGHGAMWLAMRHPDIWGNAGSMSGGLDIRPFPDSWKMKQRLGSIEKNSGIWDSHAAISLVPTLKPGQLNITIDCGVDDFFFEVNNNMHQALLDAGINHDYTVRPGGHSHGYWANSILYHLLFFNEQFNK